MNGLVSGYVVLSVALVSRRGGLSDQLGRSVVHGFGRAVGSMLAHQLGLPVAGALVLVVILGSLARRRPARARGRRRP